MQDVICQVEGCSASVWIKKRQLCQHHYNRWWRTGDAGSGSAALRERECSRCGKQFTASTPGQKYCGATCKRQRASCSSCGKAVHRTVTSKAEIVCQQCRRQQSNRGYTSAHMRVAAQRGRARDQKCEHCDQKADHWAYDHSDPDEVNEVEVGVGRNGRERTWRRIYSRDPQFYIALCRKCHGKFDEARRLARYSPSDLMKRPATEWSLDELSLGWGELPIYMRWRREVANATRVRLLRQAV